MYYSIVILFFYIQGFREVLKSLKKASNPRYRKNNLWAALDVKGLNTHAINSLEFGLYIKCISISRPNFKILNDLRCVFVCVFKQYIMNISQLRGILRPD